ncbi:hypothetical protein HDV64DRAFT_257684 [Trichoderma sp. TUCIM 5745]
MTCMNHARNLPFWQGCVFRIVLGACLCAYIIRVNYNHTPPYKCLDALVLASLGKRHWTRVVFGRIYVLLLLFFVCVYLLLYMHGRRVYAGLRHGLSLGNRHEDGSWGDGDLDESRGLF